MKLIRAADLFCGAGGTSTGLALACQDAGVNVDLLAINHWTVAVETHQANHPWARHLCKALHEVDPRKVVPGGRLNILVASPECTHHSIARGGRPVSDQMRASAWQIVDWLAKLHVDNVLIENVREFRDWGPIGANGRPMKSKRGQTYAAFLDAIRSLGYAVEDRILNAADFGDPTTRERLFIIARRGRRKIRWPEASHSPTGMFGERWRAAREIIDWSIQGESIFNRKRPLSPNTLARIAAGLKRFSGLSIVLPPRGYDHRNGKANRPRSTDEPVQTITSRGGGHLVEPFIVPVNHGAGDVRARSVDDPLPTLTAKANQYLAQPFLVSLRGTAPDQLARSTRSVDEPAPTVAANGGHLGVCEPFILPHRMFDGMQVDSIDRPLRTLTAKNGGCFGLVRPFLVPFFGEREGQAPRTHSIDDPLPAVTSHSAGALVEPFLVKYNGTGGARSVDEPLDTLTTKDRYALVEVDGELMALDIRFRLLQPHELARAMGFPEGYKFAGTREDQVRQIGNAVAVRTARALCAALLETP